MIKNDGGYVLPSVYFDRGIFDAARAEGASVQAARSMAQLNAPGMTRRQLYAGLAMMADLASGVAMETDEQRAGNARFHWRMADALLATEEE